MLSDLFFIWFWHLYCPIADKVLIGCVIDTQNVAGKMACVMKCSEHPLCDSVNFEEALNSNNLQKCELNYHQNDATCSNHFFVRPGFSYYELDDDKKGMKSMYLFHYMCVFIFTCTCGSGGSKILKAGQWDVKERKTCLVLPRKFLPELVMLFPDFCGNHERHFKRLSNSCG